MSDNRETMRVRIDGYTRLCLTAIAVLLTVMIIGLWADHAPTPAPAMGQINKPFLDTSTQTQLVELVKAQRQTTAKMDELIRLLRSGQVKVKIAGQPEKNKGGKKNAAAKAKK